MLSKNVSPLIALTANSCWNIVNFRSGLIEALQSANCRVVVLAPQDAHSKKLVQRGIPLVSLRIDNKGQSPVRDLRLIAQYQRELLRIAPDAMLTFTVKPNIYGSLAAALLGIPTINNVSGLGTAFIAGGGLERLVSLLYRAALHRSSTVFFQNSDDRALFEARRIVTPRQAMLINGSGVNLNHFKPRHKPASKGGPTFLQVGRLLWDKGVGEFIEAARIVRTQLPGARFQLLGGMGADNRTAVAPPEVKRWVEGGIVEYLGEQNDVRPYLAAADCVVLASYREGLPRSLIEAAAMGRPAIATDVPGCRAAVDDGVTGYLCEVRSGQALAEAMLRFAALEPGTRAEIGRAARQKAVREFDERTVAGAYVEALARAGVLNGLDEAG